MSIILLKTLVETNSNSFNLKGLEEVRGCLEVMMTPLKAKMKIHGKTLFFTKRPRAPIQILLGGHYDTVHLKESSFQKLSHKKSGILTGPGTADMKGGLVILFKALEAFEKSPHAKNVGWRLFFNGDEEIGSPESGPLLESFSKGCQAAFLFEPSMPDGSLVESRKGSANITVHSKGKPAHAGRDLEKGRNAILPLLHLAAALDGIPGLNIAEIKGGHAFNVVPSYAALKLNYRSERKKDFEIFFKKLKLLIKDDHLTYEMISYRPPKPLDGPTKKLIKALDYPVKNVSSGGVCDGNLLADYGIPTVDTLGAIGGSIHTDEEYIEAESLKSRADLFLNFLMRLSKGDVKLC